MSNSRIFADSSLFSSSVLALRSLFANTPRFFSALSQVQVCFTGVKWFVEGDIKSFFDNIDHEVMVGPCRIFSVIFLGFLRLEIYPLAGLRIAFSGVPG